MILLSALTEWVGETMSLKFWAAAFAAALSYACAANAEPAALAAYGNLPSLSHVQLSPDGKSLAYVKSDPSRRFVVVMNLDTRKITGAINIGPQKLRDLLWADNDHLVITVSSRQHVDGLLGNWHEYWQAMWYDVDTKSQHDFFNNVKTEDGHALEHAIMNVIDGPLQPRVVNGHTYVFFEGVFFQGENGRTGLFREDLTDGTCVMYAKLEDTYNPNTYDWLIDANGNIVAAQAYDAKTKAWTLQVYHGDKASMALSTPVNIDTPDTLGLSRDGTAVVISLPQPHKDDKYEQVSLKDGSVSPWSDAGQTDGFPLVDPRTGRIIGRSSSKDKNGAVYFDPKTALMWQVVETVFKDAADVDFTSWSDDRTRVVVHVYGPRYGDRFFLIDLAAKSAMPIGNEYDGITDFSPVKWISYKASDGHTIHAYLTLPQNRDSKNLPLIVMPHGGPFSQDDSGFDWWSQALASRGYAVLQPEFRGSAGFGVDLLTAGFGEFGKKMQTDLSDGVDALATQGTIDPKRVCIVGASYGGYAALAGVTLQNGIYRCAVSVSGISDLSALLESWGWPNGSLDDTNERYWDRFLGVTGPDDKRLNAISPIKHVDAVTVPILLIHGSFDTVVDESQSEDMAAALRKAGKTVQFVELENEDHWLSHGKTRLQMLEATVHFLEENDPAN